MAVLLYIVNQCTDYESYKVRIRNEFCLHMTSWICSRAWLLTWAGSFSILTTFFPYFFSVEKCECKVADHKRYLSGKFHLTTCRHPGMKLCMSYSVRNISLNKYKINLWSVSVCASGSTWNIRPHSRRGKMKVAGNNFDQNSKTWKFRQNEDCQLHSTRSRKFSRGHRRTMIFKVINCG